MNIMGVGGLELLVVLIVALLGAGADAAWPSTAARWGS